MVVVNVSDVRAGEAESGDVDGGKCTAEGGDATGGVGSESRRPCLGSNARGGVRGEGL